MQGSEKPLPSRRGNARIGVTPLRAVVFDFDLTLADTRQGIVQCVNYALEGIGLPEVSYETVAATIGDGHRDRFLLLAGAQHAARFDEYAALYQQRSHQVMEALTFFYPPAPAVVRALKQRGLKLAIVSSAFHLRIEQTLGKTGLRDCFDVIVGYDDVPAYKPDPYGLLEALQRLGCAPAESLYVGDHTIDAETAQRAGVPFAAVLTGMTPREAFVPYPSVAILQDLEGLPGLLNHAQRPGGEP
ncbi:MAG: HAD-IA family hydrolase [Chloroflexi bacterium]|nr:HAD-IA family hydrolase [Chloroflexota bacterium]